MKKTTLLKSMLLLFALIVGSTCAWAAKITNYTNIVSGKSYYIGATTSSTDYYLSVDGSTVATGVAGTAVTDKASATIFVFEGSDDSWAIKFKSSGNYMSLASSKANGKVDIVASSTNWEASNVSEKIHLAINGFALNKNNSGTQFGSYASTQTDVWLEEATTDPEAEVNKTSIDFGKVAYGKTKSETFTITPANLKSDLSITCNNAKYEVTPTSIAQATTVATTITVTAKPTAIDDNMNGTITISGGGLASNKTVTLSCTVKDPGEVSYNFADIDGFSSWGNSYSEHNVNYSEAKVTFTAAGKQTNNITDIPVQKAGDVIVTLNNKSEIITSVTFECRQWTTKTQTIQLYASSNSGSTWTKVGNDETDFDIESDALPANTNAVKLTSTNASNQIGIESVTFTIDQTKCNLTTNAGKWTSFTPSWNVTLASGATAYIITDVSGSAITATPVTVLKAEAGYFVKGAAASTSYTATRTDTDATSTTGNMIQGCLEPTTISNAKIGDADNTKDKYVLGTATIGGNSGKSGLFLVGSSNVTVGAGKAFLLTNTTSGAHVLSLDFGDVTGIQTIKAQKELLEGDFYNLKGQKVAQPTKGLYIVNGRKVVIK